VGPHADRLDFELFGRQARAFASQGQQRAMILAWKIAEIENLRDHLGYQPLLLLDDVSSELDPERNRQLLAYLEAFEGQVVLTTTDPTPLLRSATGETRYLAVREGSFRPASSEELYAAGPERPNSE
jgi:DNA replication and repair protein RecF